jgi:hypothetical protein
MRSRRNQRWMAIALLAMAIAGCGDNAVDPPAVDAPPGPFDVPAQCTSGARWKLGDQRSPLMYPGRACNACHESRIDTPRFEASGTVYPTGHEPDNCNGAVGASVTITDASGATFSAISNDAGNFMVDATIEFPIHATVMANGATRSMSGAVMTGDCNGCHTQTGAQAAPGRIVLP